MRTSAIDLTKIYKKKGWVVISYKDNKVFGVGKTLKEAMKIVNKSKIKDPTVFKLGPIGVPYVG